MHHLPIDRCPFRRDLDVLLDGAAAAVATGTMRSDDFDAQRAECTPAELLALALRDRPASEDLAVCHGDACLPNVLIDPQSGHVTGVVDVGRLGVADRHSDLALAVRSLGDAHLNPGYGPAAAADFLGRYPVRADRRRLDYYQLLDEFF
jgi:kanamycin kinase